MVGKSILEYLHPDDRASGVDVVGLSAALIVIPVMVSLAGIAIRCTTAFDAADEFHRD